MGVGYLNKEQRQKLMRNRDLYFPLVVDILKRGTIPKVEVNESWKPIKSYYIFGEISENIFLYYYTGNLHIGVKNRYAEYSSSNYAYYSSNPSKVLAAVEYSGITEVDTVLRARDIIKQAFYIQNKSSSSLVKENTPTVDGIDVLREDYYYEIVELFLKGMQPTYFITNAQFTNTKDVHIILGTLRNGLSVVYSFGSIILMTKDVDGKYVRVNDKIFYRYSKNAKQYTLVHRGVSENDLLQHIKDLALKVKKSNGLIRS